MEFNPRPSGPLGQRQLTKLSAAELDPAEFACELRLELDPARWHGGYVPEKFGDRRMSDQVGRFVKLLRETLKGRNAELANGRRVESYADGIMWILEQFTGKMPLEKLP